MYLMFQKSDISNLNFVNGVNFTDQTVCSLGIQSDFEAFSVDSRKTRSTRWNNMKLDMIPPT